jgi:predicted secreted protein
MGKGAVALLVLALVVFLLTFSIFVEVHTAEASQMMWSQAYGGANEDASTSLVQTADGRYALVGFTQSFGNGDTDAWLVKTDEYGNMEWNKTYGETESEEDATSLIQTLDGGYAFAGSKAKGTNPWSIEYDAWLVKTDETGNIEWSRIYGGTGSDSFFSLIQTAEGDFVLAGSTTSFGAGDKDFWLIKTDSSGSTEWNRTYGSSDVETNPYALVQTSDGGFALAGQAFPFGGSYCDSWLVKTDGYGNMEWNRKYGGTGMDYATSLVQTADGGFALAGCTDSVGAGGYDFWLIKTDSYGNVKWNQTYGTEYQDTNPSLVQTLDGGFALAGYTNPDLADLMLVKTDSFGNIEWNQTYHGQAVSGLPSLVQTLDGGFALAGAKGFRSVNSDDFWLIKTNEYGIVPEFPSWAFLPLFIITTSLTVLVYFKKRKRKMES